MPRILVVEDDDLILELVSSALREDGFDVDTATNGAEAITKIGDIPPSVILLDLVMPVMNGWQFMREYRGLPGCAETPILVMTAAVRPRLDSFGKYELLTKAFDM